MKSTAGFKLTLWFGLIVGIGLFVWAYMANTNYENLMANGVKTDAVVTEVTEVKYKKGNPSTYGIAVYRDETGSEHSFDGYLGDYINVGDKVTIIYNKDNPDEVVKENPWIFMMYVISGGMIVFCGGMLLLLTFWRMDKKSVSCVHQSVSPSELTRIVTEYMPQTKQKFIKERSRNKHFDKLGYDAVMERSIQMGDPVKQIYDNYKLIMSSDNIRLGAVVRALDRDIYSDMTDVLSESMETGRSRYTVPVFMVYSYDDYFHSHPNDLIEVANRLSGSGFGTVFSEKDMELITYLSDDTSRPFGLSYQSDMTFGREIVVSTVILSKPNLCNKKLCNKLLYLAVKGQFAAAIPAWYYTMWELSAF